MAKKVKDGNKTVKAGTYAAQNAEVKALIAARKKVVALQKKFEEKGAIKYDPHQAALNLQIAQRVVSALMDENKATLVRD